MTHSRDRADSACSFPAESRGWPGASKGRAECRSGVASSDTGGWRSEKTGCRPPLGTVTLRVFSGLEGSARVLASVHTHFYKLSPF